LRFFGASRSNEKWGYRDRRFINASKTEHFRDLSAWVCALWGGGQGTSMTFCAIPQATARHWHLTTVEGRRLMSKTDGALRLDERLRNWANADKAWSDGADAARVEAAWRRLATHHQELLRMAYVWRADRGVICRRLKIPQRPWYRYELEVTQAKAALDRFLREEQG
jgi:hypothetical protein